MLIAIIPRALPWARSFWAFSPSSATISGLTPKQIVKAITSALPTSKEEGAKIVPMGAEGSKPRVYVEPESAAFVADPIVRSMSKEELEKSIANTTALMKQAAKDLDFMQAAQYRDEIIRLQKELEEKDKFKRNNHQKEGVS